VVNVEIVLSAWTSREDVASRLFDELVRGTGDASTDERRLRASVLEIRNH
jgi:hypothetical protein